MCTPASSCTKNVPPTQTDTSVAYYCFMNGVKIASSLYNETRTKSDGSICYSADVTNDPAGLMYTYTWKNAAGATVATEMFDYSDASGGAIHKVACGGTTTMVDTSSPACQTYLGQQNPNVDTLCTASSACTLSMTGTGGAGGVGGTVGTGGAGGAVGTGGAGGTTTGGPGGSAPAAGGASGVGGAGGAAGCDVGKAMCGGACADLMLDAANCGQCGNRCNTGFTCMQGACAAVNICNATTEHLCSGSCVDFTTDSKNCGGCGIACPLGEFCSSTIVSGTPTSACTTTCAAGMLMCGADCKPARDDRNCGSCDTVCGPTTICCSKALSDVRCDDVVTPPAAGATYACRQCPGTDVACNSACTQLATDANNCGQCGVVCQFGCRDGKCNTNGNQGGSCSYSAGPVSSRGTVYGLVGVGLFLAIIVSRRQRRR